jgi:hypothetical protein
MSFVARVEGLTLDKAISSVTLGTIGSPVVFDSITLVSYYISSLISISEIGCIVASSVSHIRFRLNSKSSELSTCLSRNAHAESVETEPERANG